MTDNKEPVDKWVVKKADWVALIILLLVGALSTYFVFQMHSMQLRQISEVNKWIDAGGGEIREISRLVGKDMILSQNSLFFAFIITVSCLLIIIGFLLFTYFRSKRKIKKGER